MAADPSPLPILSYAPSRLIAGRTVVFTFRVPTPELDQGTFEVGDLSDPPRGTEFCNPIPPGEVQEESRPEFSMGWILTGYRTEFGGRKKASFIKSGTFTSDMEVVSIERVVPKALSMGFVLETHNGKIEHPDVPIFRT